MNRLEWILGIALVVLLLGVAALSLVFWFGGDGRANAPAANSATALAQSAKVIAPTSVFTGETAKMAYARAQQTAAAWQADAKLLNATATWAQGATAEQIRQGYNTWGFTFYSPAAQEIAVISVVEDTVSVVSQGEHTAESPILEASGWNLDSNEVITTLLNDGGEQFLAEQGITTLMMMLTTENEKGDGRMEWQVNLVSVQNARALKMRIDATSGEVLENTTVP
jgi:hypothetical protein